MREKFTAGPWVVHPMRSSKTGLDAGRGFDYPWHIVPESHASRQIGGSIDKEYDRATYAKEICAFGDFSRFDHSEVVANARLIASAPDLYAALEQVQIDIKRAATNNVIWPDTQRQIEAALLKARGTEVTNADR